MSTISVADVNTNGFFWLAGCCCQLSRLYILPLWFFPAMRKRCTLWPSSKSYSSSGQTLPAF
ncbi:hypothetical protein DL95DRAFT_391385 [Leptodontidium sp. 2 PMI_412]|nr:hypothetical protein DL95DRAFT_391385 [Leptodontidium sp. 2 PMI_412]